MIRRLLLLAAAPAVALLFFAPSTNAQQGGSAKISFRRTVLDTVFRSEGVAVGDFNKDGRLDLAVSNVTGPSIAVYLNTLGK